MRSIALLLVACSFALPAPARQPGLSNFQQGGTDPNAATGQSKSQAGKEEKTKKDADPQAAKSAKGQSQDSQKGSQCDSDPQGMVIPCTDPKPICKDSHGNPIPCKQDPPPKNDCAEGPHPEGAVIPCTDQKIDPEKSGGFGDSKKRTELPGKSD
jgi:hypothetical protein